MEIELKGAMGPDEAGLEDADGVVAAREEVRKPRAAWPRDPCRDVEETPGFEGHGTELAAYHRGFVRRNRGRRDEEPQEKALTLGCPGNLDLAAHVEGLETGDRPARGAGGQMEGRVMARGRPSSRKKCNPGLCSSGFRLPTNGER